MWICAKIVYTKWEFCEGIAQMRKRCVNHEKLSRLLPPSVLCSRCFQISIPKNQNLRKRHVSLITYKRNLCYVLKQSKNEDIQHGVIRIPSSGMPKDYLKGGYRKRNFPIRMSKKLTSYSCCVNFYDPLLQSIFYSFTPLHRHTLPIPLNHCFFGLKLSGNF